MAAVTIASYLLLGTLHWKILIVVSLTTGVMEAIRGRTGIESAAPFLLRHGVSFLILLGLACYFPDAANSGWWTTRLQPDLRNWYFASLAFISGVILCVPAGGALIGKLIGPFGHEIRESDIAGLKEGGRYIGWLERILVMLLVLMDQRNGIGFLIAAKSILRFGEIKDASQRKVAEYIIIGTFLSFGWALLISVLTRKAVQYWVR